MFYGDLILAAVIVGSILFVVIQVIYGSVFMIKAIDWRRSHKWLMKVVDTLVTMGYKGRAVELLLTHGYYGNVDYDQYNWKSYLKFLKRGVIPIAPLKRAKGENK